MGLLTRLIHCLEIFTAIFNPTDRAAEMACRKWDQKVFGIEFAAGTETATDVGLNVYQQRS